MSHFGYDHVWRTYGLSLGLPVVLLRSFKEMLGDDCSWRYGCTSYIMELLGFFVVL